MKRISVVSLFALLGVSSHAFGVPFTVDGSALMVTGGNVGIGTNTPAGPLEIDGSANSYLNTLNLRNNSNGASAINRIQIGNDASIGSAQILLYGSQYTGTPNLFSIVNANNYPLTLGTNNVERVRIDSSGNVGIGTTSPGSKLDVSGTIRQSTVISCLTGLTTDANGGITGCAASDRRLKKNIADLKYSPNLIDSLRPVSYDWDTRTSTRTVSESTVVRSKNPKVADRIVTMKRDEVVESVATLRDLRNHAGFVAQDVEKVFPQAVVSAGKNLEGIDSNAMIAVLVKEIQDLRARVKVLEATQH